MTRRFRQWTLDVLDVPRMAQFWSAALGYEVDRDEDGTTHLRPPAGAPADLPSVWLQPTDVEHGAKNRNHPDLVALDGEADAEADRLVALGASRIDVG